MTQADGPFPGSITRLIDLVFLFSPAVDDEQMVSDTEFRVAGGNYELAVTFYHQYTHTLRKILVLELNS